MIDRITIKERGATPRRMMKAHNASAKEAWYMAGRLFHETMRDKRFTAEHGRKANYAKRKGEESGIDTKAFFRSYTGRKLRKWGHRRPMEWSGDTRRNVRYANINNTSKGCRVAYPGANKLNYRPRGGRINMADEFRRLLPEEINKLAEKFDTSYEFQMGRDNTTTITQV